MSYGEVSNRPVDERTEFDQLRAHFAARLAAGRPGPAAQRRLSPELSYGRHFGPTPATVRSAAVLVLIYPTPSGWAIPVTVRAAQLKVHAGQICLPGGRTEAGETAEETALREFREELGDPPANLELLGPLSPVFVWVSNSLITPYLAIAPKAPQFKPSPDEVAEVVEIRLQELTREVPLIRHKIRRRGLNFGAPHYQIGEHSVWGATSMILAEVAALLA